MIGVPAHRMRIGLPDFAITRPMRYALGNLRSSSSASFSGSEISSPPEVCGSYNRSSNSDWPSTQEDAKSRLFFKPPGIAPWRAYSSRARKKLDLARIDLDGYFTGQRHLARMANETKAGDVGAAVHLVIESMASHAARFSVSMDFSAPSTSASLAMPALQRR